MRDIAVGVIVLVALTIYTPARAHADELAEGAALYQEQCSVCHGMIASEASHRFRAPPPQRFELAVAMLSREAGITAFARGMQAMIPPAGAGRFDSQPAADDHRVVVVPPFGPPLRGVVGRMAGSVEGFTYSQAFKRVLQGVTWNQETLERWITNSQAWVPGSMMFYEQPDPEIRRQIIAYLEANR
jgi:cytochrome c2